MQTFASSYILQINSHCPVNMNTSFIYMDKPVIDVMRTVPFIQVTMTFNQPVNEADHWIESPPLTSIGYG